MYQNEVLDMDESDRQECFYCGALVTKNSEDDHFPFPDRHGGTQTVPCCISCHDMKDRFPLYEWPMDWIGKVIEDFPKLNRETRIFLAKTIQAFADAQASINRRKDENRPQNGTGA
jgi:hypothetical protein